MENKAYFDKVKKYRTKRNFEKTTEPKGKSQKKTKTDQSIFVIQKHDASNIHFDFRLEVDGVLKSWAVPKGLSTDPSEKRLAMQTEDHPLDYADFEGYIPEENYGAGTVMIWDRGTYKNIRKEKDNISMKTSLEEGKVEVWLKGEKLSGGYVLIHTGKRGENQWLIKKMEDNQADARRNPVKTENKSVVTNRSMHKIKEEDKK